MVCAFFILLAWVVLAVAGPAAALWFAGKRAVRHLKKNPPAAKRLFEVVAEDVVVPILEDLPREKPEEEPKEGKPEGKQEAGQKIPYPWGSN